MTNIPSNKAAEANSRRLYVFNGGFLTQPRIRRILSLSGYDIRVGKPSSDGLIGVWGHSPTSGRGEFVAEKTDAEIVRVEDAFLRSVLPARLSDEAPLGLCIDHSGVHFDPSKVSDLEDILTNAPLDDTALLNRARDAIARINDLKLSKYNNFPITQSAPDPGYVVVVDQTRDDAAVTASGADLLRFKEMLVFAQTEHPAAKILIKTHPETEGGARQGYYSKKDATGRVSLFTDEIAPQTLFEGAIAVYTVSSQMGFEAIFSGHKPRVFGQPFYAGWGLTQDEYPVPRRERKLSRPQLFAAAMILYPKWYDPYDDQLCELEDVIETLAVQSRAWREDSRGYTALGMRLWKRKSVQNNFGTYRPVTFANSTESAIEKAGKSDSPILVWASHVTSDLLTAANTAHTKVVRAEDGFLRSRGLGADLVPAMSLVLDHKGIYYDPRSASSMEDHISASVDLSPFCLERAEALRAGIVNAGLSKYNLSQPTVPTLPSGHRILVVGQVEDDASIKAGCQKIRTNLDLLKETRRLNPDATMIFKPHPDVEAKLRDGGLSNEQALAYCDCIASTSDPISLISEVQEVWTMTSLLGFEALIRGVPVICLGAPFYSGWGLTRDLGDIPARRHIGPSLTGLVHAALIDTPRYFDPKTGLPCPPEVVLQRLSEHHLDHKPQTRGLRVLSKIQGVFAGLAPLWRR